MSAINTKNSTSTPLLNGQIFVGRNQEVDEYATISVGVITDQDGVLYIEQSSDAVNWDKSDSFTVLATVQKSELLYPVYKFARVRFENDSGADQSYLRLQTVLSKDRPALPDTSALSSESTLANCETLLTSIETNTATSGSVYDPQLSLASGDISGAFRVILKGRGTMITTDRVPGDATGITYNPLRTAESWEILSSLNTDSDGSGINPMGAGAWEITIEGIDSAGFYTTEFVPLDGTNPSPVPGSWLCVNRLYVSNLDPSVTSNVGTITLRVAGGGVTRHEILPNNSEGYQMRYRAPLGSALYLREISWGTRDYAVIVTATLQEYNPTTGIYRRICQWELDDAAAPQKIDLGGQRIEGEIVMFARLSAGTHAVTCQLIADQKTIL
jgi:hypothetical protein